ncbi:hypothetical protein EG68_06459 [Paragonimus skrjabini miyazakii]|uniref:Uncharacterized protein n=1 Tax=Paragonimus skrjabini miyazakii TaxID=59628 RepID=A0A8S9YYA1_9TREM|nr:hypothetical protein EG68_06459 [Paragonimus skrjabini miyazakii]
MSSKIHPQEAALTIICVNDCSSAFASRHLYAINVVNFIGVIVYGHADSIEQLVLRCCVLQISLFPLVCITPQCLIAGFNRPVTVRFVGMRSDCLDQ